MRHRFPAWLLSIGICAMCAQPLQAQMANPEQFYLYVAPGVVSGVQIGPAITVDPYGSFQIGGGAEKFLFKGLAVGAELAKSPEEIRSKPVTYTYRAFDGREDTATYAASGVWGWGSLNLSYHFKGLSVSGSLVPFVTAGRTIFCRDGITEAINYGGGISFWRSRHRGWRLEYRKHVVDDGGGFDSRLRSVRIGLVLR